ncbi:hypothetical protein ROZALSC1DRAFT_31447, partial [Rozella allomycis CSF55]
VKPCRGIFIDSSFHLPSHMLKFFVLVLLSFECLCFIAESDIKFTVKKNLEITAPNEVSVYGDKVKFQVSVKNKDIKDFEFSYGGNKVKLSAKGNDAGEFNGQLLMNAKLEYVYKGLEKGQVVLSHNVVTLLSFKGFSSRNSINHSSSIWSFAYPIVCKDRQYILGNWLIGNKIAGENVNFCLGVEGTYRFEKDEEP